MYAAYFRICPQDKSFPYILGIFRAIMCYDSVIGSENTPCDPPPHVKYALDTRTKNFHYTIIFKLVPKFKLLHQTEVKM